MGKEAVAGTSVPPVSVWRSPENLNDYVCTECTHQQAGRLLCEECESWRLVNIGEMGTRHTDWRQEFHKALRAAEETGSSCGIMMINENKIGWPDGCHAYNYYIDTPKRIRSRPNNYLGRGGYEDLLEANQCEEKGDLEKAYAIRSIAYRKLYESAVKGVTSWSDVARRGWREVDYLRRLLEKHGVEFMWPCPTCTGKLYPHTYGNIPEWQWHHQKEKCPVSKMGMGDDMGYLEPSEKRSQINDMYRRLDQRGHSYNRRRQRGRIRAKCGEAQG